MKKLFLLGFVAMSLTVLYAQDQAPSPYDYGKMWTFENPPTEWFKEAYGMDVDQTWFDEVREASLRFATWCSASFVSPNGLIMTNHHCSRSVVGALQKDGESFDKDGFYASSLAEERKADGLFVEQLIKTDDITDDVKNMIGKVENDADRATKTAEALEQIQEQYSNAPGWEDLRLQVVTYYSGGKYSIYGYKRYDDIRLVLIPELDLGFYGGDPDNFTYPRYNLDCTFWRAYDENGEPLNTSDNYFQWNPNGLDEGTPVFVIGNPGNTERYRTVSQLEYDRDYRYPILINWMQHRHDMMAAEYEENPSDELLNTVFSFSNSLKAFKGIVGGLEDEELFTRKVAMERMIRAKASSDEPWVKLTEYYDELSPRMGELQHLSPNPQWHGKTITLLHTLYQYQMMASENPEDEQLGAMKDGILQAADGIDSEKERMLLGMVLGELKASADPGDDYIDEILDGRTPEVAANEIMDKTVFADQDKLAKLLDKPKKAAKGKDPLWEMAALLIPEFQKSVEMFQSTSTERSALEEEVAYEVFNVLGDNLPPDATFTLRISDGVVKGYDYNGTVAPWKTTYYGMYDRHYSNDKQFPWSLPAKWANPPAEMLKEPVNFVSTNDIIGGNSGSPVINQNREVVGLIFDGNIESLPGNFIFDEEYNRSVSVHAGGITAALKYIYKADRLLDELMAD